MISVEKANEIAKYISLGLPHYSTPRDQRNFIVGVFETYGIVEEKDKQSILDMPVVHTSVEDMEEEFELG